MVRREARLLRPSSRLPMPSETVLAVSNSNSKLKKMLCPPGLAKHKDELGAPLCPCRHYEDKAAEVQLAYWNCPCVPMRERKECHCMLFLTPETPFVGTEQKLPNEMLKDEGLGVK